jgi:hypothetical protein
MEILIIIGYVIFAAAAVFTFIDFIRYVNKKLNEKN